MAQIENWSHAAAGDFASPFVVNTITTGIARWAWQWFNDHADESIRTVRFLFIKVTIRVRDIRPLWEMIFGQEPRPSWKEAP